MRLWGWGPCSRGLQEGLEQHGWMEVQTAGFMSGRSSVWCSCVSQALARVQYQDTLSWAEMSTPQKWSRNGAGAGAPTRDQPTERKTTLHLVANSSMD